MKLAPGAQVGIFTNLDIISPMAKITSSSSDPNTAVLKRVA